jgi:hypothetical protein
MLCHKLAGLFDASVGAAVSASISVDSVAMEKWEVM